MSYNNAKVNPFYIQDDEEDPWDDDEDYDDYDYDDEQVMLMSGNGGIKNRKYNNDSRPMEISNRQQQQQQHNYSNNSHYNRSYHNGQYERNDSHRQHKPQLWKYLFLLVTILGVIVFGTSLSSDSKNSEYNVSVSSLVEKIPNNEISNDEYRIVVLGERHSGTAWMRERLRECFPHVEVSNHLQRMGYFFQDDEETARSKAQDSEHLATIHDTNTTTIVVHVTLNVYDWLEQMRLSPEYAPDHAGKHQELDHPVPLGWKEFLSKPWTTERPDSDLGLVNSTGPVCQMGFQYDEVVSCSQSAKGIGDPMYELYENGQPFGSIIDLRAAKLKNHHGVLESWPSVKKMIQVSYETTAQDFKTKLLHEILEFTGWNDVPCSGDIPPPSLDSSKDMTVEFVEFVNERANWETEERVASYSKWTEQDIAFKNIASEPIEKASTEEDKEKREEAKGETSTEDESTESDETMESSNQSEEEEETTAKSEDEKSESKSSSDKDDSSAAESSAEEKPVEEEEEEEESNKDESNTMEEAPKQTEESKDSAESASEEKEEEKSSAAKESEESVSEEAGDADSEEETTEEAEALDKNTKSNKNVEETESETKSDEDADVDKDESPVDENEEETKIEDEKEGEEEEETKIENEMEKETKEDETLDEASESGESETETNSNEDDAGDETESESNENDRKQ
eukprot:CAMPEP_0116144080 /NCGR_PEP_ID=MMETSP0329-20121206/15798_1 /TAXON_ID=697910 /ORGANISM="Pseudo-nitzschia arenysensis, Strain B593" /LENGTH=684 /DNA_ID=CAMNT_0003639453 /DNA_START=149 /DNA_END=2203 /DNA_ORIENTATION=-